MKNFKLFLESGILGWNGKELTTSMQRITIFIDSNRISIDNISPKSPEAKIIVKHLINRNNDYANYKLDFDGYQIPTLKQFLSSSQDSKLPKFAYHGTSTHSWQTIKDQGLIPRMESGKNPTNDYSDETKVYLSGTLNNTVKFFARDAAKDGSKPLIIQIDTSFLDKRLLSFDEDSKEKDWLKSLHFINNFAYSGTIVPQAITPVLVIKDGKWSSFNANIDDPKDPIAKQYSKILKTKQSGFFKL